MIEVKSIFSGGIIATSEKETIMDAIIELVKQGADLRGADGSLKARLAWQSHDLLAEILRRAAGDDVEKIKVAGFILLCREKCWCMN